MKFSTKLVILASVAVSSLLASCCYFNQKKENKPVIVLTAFGTSVDHARKVFDYINEKTKERFAGHEVRWAFTSSFIQKKLKKQGVITYNLKEVIADLRSKNVKDIVVQSLHIAPGQEFNEIKKVDMTGLNVSVGKALLAEDQDLNEVLAAVKPSMINDAPNVFVAHGNDHHLEYNKRIVDFNDVVLANTNDTYVCSVEGLPGTDKLATVKDLAAKSGKVNFVPLMIVAGDHVMNDIMGEEAEAWKNIISARETTCTKPLGYNDAILEIYFKHLDTAIKSL